MTTTETTTQPDEMATLRDALAAALLDEDVITRASNMLTARGAVQAALDAALPMLLQRVMVRPADPGQLSDGWHTFDELYGHRHALFCALTRCLPDIAWRTREHEDGSMYPGMFLAGIELPTGTISYHLPDRCWDLLDGVRVLDRAPRWDGYTPGDVVDRINAWRPNDDVEQMLAETGFGGIEVSEGALTVTAHPPHRLVAAVAAAMAETLGEAPNYSETGFSLTPSPAGQFEPEFTLTVQRVKGKTPAELRREADAKVAVVRDLVEAAEHQALRWQEPLPVPTWVEDAKTALGLDSQKTMHEGCDQCQGAIARAGWEGLIYR
jgi:hypothetical protein